MALPLTALARDPGIIESISVVKLAKNRVAARKAGGDS